MRTVLLLAVFAVAVTAFDRSLYTKTPAGLVLSHCVHKVPSGSSLKQLSTGETEVTLLAGSTYNIPKCDTRNDTLPVLIKTDQLGPDVVQTSRQLLQLPPDYDGWTTYTAFNSAPGIDVFVGYFSVPDLPRSLPDILYIFTGLQNIDWIPKVDPMPSPAQQFDIIQPVLQYPGDFGNYWSVKSWYVTVDSGAVYSDEIRCQPGDNIFGNMTRTGKTAYFIGSTVRGKTTSINADHARLSIQPWAYNTLECYGCSDCSTYPTKPVQFTKLALYKGVNQVTPNWLVTPKPPVQTFCKEKSTVNDPTSVTISFN